MGDLATAFLFLILVIAAVTDIRSRRIPNWLVYPSILLGIAYNIWTGGINGLFFSLQGLGLAMLLLIFFYIAGGMGAGDVKLMGAVGSFLGPLGSFRAFLCTALVGGLYALVVIIRTEGLKSTIRRFGAIAVNLYSKITYKPMYVSHAGFKGMPVLYYGVAIAIGTFLSMLDCTKEILF